MLNKGLINPLEYNARKNTLVQQMIARQNLAVHRLAQIIGHQINFNGLVILDQMPDADFERFADSHLL